jgi:hypothetical protein
VVPALRALGPALRDRRLRGLAAEGRIRLALPGRERVPDADARDLDLPALQELHGLTGLPVDGLPVCLGTAAAPPETSGLLDLTLLDPAGRLDLIRFTDEFISRGAMVHSGRCAACALADTCPGLHITSTRRFGLGRLTPQRT